MAARPPRFVAVLAVACLLAPCKAIGLKTSSGKVRDDVLHFDVTFTEPRMTPIQFLFVSSPIEKKVVYTELRNFKSMTGRTYALIDSGLGEPCGIALDRQRAALYVADRQAMAIYRYMITAKKEGANSQGDPVWSLSTDGSQLVVIKDVPVEWLSVDLNGDVFYTDKNTSSINRIPADVIAAIAEKNDNRALQVAQKAKKSFYQKASSTTQTSPYSLPLYVGSTDSHVTSPAGVVSDGMRVYWVNNAGGQQSGVVMEGQVDPRVPVSPLGDVKGHPFQSIALAKNTDVAYGVAKATSLVMYSGLEDGGGVVYGLEVNAPALGVVTLVSGLLRPRGLVWDGDETAYVADEAGDTVYSFPSGRLGGDVPTVPSVPFRGAFGVALLSATDAGFGIAVAFEPKVHSGTARHRISAGLLACTLAVAFLVGDIQKLI